MRDWLPEDDLAHFIVAAVERVPLDAFQAKVVASGKAQYHPRLMLALLVYCYANGVFSSRRIERATFRDIGVRYVAANLHPDHDTIAAFRRANRAAFEAAFLQVLLLARESGLLRLGMVAIDGTKLRANASRHKAMSYGRMIPNPADWLGGLWDSGVASGLIGWAAMIRSLDHGADCRAPAG